MNVEEIVKASGVSRSTVFRFLRGENVRANAKTAIISAMDKLGYANERAVNSQLNVRIEVSTSEEMDGFLGFAQVVKGITFAAEQKGVKVNLVRRSAEQIKSAYDNLDSSVLGVIVMGKNMSEERLEAEYLIKSKMPHVFINRVLNDNALSYVSADLVSAGYDITEYLIKKGHKNIAICGDVENYRVDSDKLNGYKKALEAYNIPFNPMLYVSDAKKTDLEEIFKKFFEDGFKPDAFVGICDTYAMKFIGVAESFGYKVPDDIAVVGMDDIDSSEYFRPALTTVHIPFYEMGVLAVDSLLKQASQNVKSIRTIVNHHIVIRQSCNNNKKEE